MKYRFVAEYTDASFVCSDSVQTLYKCADHDRRYVALTNDEIPGVVIRRVADGKEICAFPRGADTPLNDVDMSTQTAYIVIKALHAEGIPWRNATIADLLRLYRNGEFIWRSCFKQSCEISALLCKYLGRF